MPYSTSQLVMTRPPVVKSAKHLFKEGDPFYSKCYVPCSARLKSGAEQGAELDLYLHSDGRWNDSADGGGWFDSEAYAKEVLAAALKM